MKSEYCSKCGHKNVYSLKAPKFCSNCGEKMASSLISSESKVRTVKRSIPLREDETAVDELPNLNGLAYEIEHDSNSFTLGSIFNNDDQKVESIARQEMKNLKRDDDA